MTDYLALSDQLHRKAMEDGSAKLLEAIVWARKGYNPGTREEPLKLPPDWTNKIAPDYSTKRKWPRAVPSTDKVRELMEEGLTANEIAAILKQSRQKVTAVMKSIKLMRHRDELDERINKALWG